MKQPLRLLFSTGSLFEEKSGVYRSVRGTTESLAVIGNSVTVVGTKDKNTDPSVVRNLGVTAHAFQSVGPYSFHYARGLNKWLNSECGAFDAAALQGIWMYTNWSVAHWCAKKRVPYAVSVRGSFNEKALSISRWKKRLSMDLMYGRLLRRATCFHALTESEYDEIRRLGFRQPIFIIPNGINVETVPLNAQSVPNSSNTTKTCLYLGRLHPIKGIPNLLRAWDSVGAISADWNLVIAGPDSNNHRAQLEAIITKSGCRNISFVGAVTGRAKSNFYQNADLFVLPSTSEGFSMSVLESMAAGVPVLLTSACRFPDAQISGAGLVVESSINGLQDGLRWFMQQPIDELRRMGDIGRALVQNNYSWHKVSQKLAAVYGWMCGRVDPPESLRFD